MALKVIKASGEAEEFDINKLINSLIHSGATEEIASDIAKKVESQITPSMPTKHIYKIARKLLRKYSKTAGMRYSIKKAIYLLGPSGYQFEKYFTGILKAYGYSAETNRFLKGYCVTHEIDIFATIDGIGSIIECKYHSNGGNPTDVKTALYVYSRFMDIKKASELNPEIGVPVKEGWLVTNTRCTSEAIQYAKCVGMKIVSWKYPSENSLEKMIEGKRLYPVTILPSIKKPAIEMLFQNNIIFVRDIAEMDEDVFIKCSKLDIISARSLKREADELYFNSKPDSTYSDH